MLLLFFSCQQEESILTNPSSNNGDIEFNGLDVTKTTLTTISWKGEQIKVNKIGN